MTAQLPDLDMPLKEAMMTQRSVRRVKADPVDDAQRDTQVVAGSAGTN